jgi:GNAT superfamily N-acetyltransferase
VNNVSFNESDYLSEMDCALCVRWHNDKRIRQFVFPHADEASYSKTLTFEDVRADRGPRPKEDYLVDLMVMLEMQPAGMASALLDPKFKKNPHSGTAWIRILIGEEYARRNGVGRYTLGHMETLCKAKGAKFAEVSHYEFDVGAKEFFRACGYRNLARIAGVTWWNEKKWAEIRMVKEL